MREPGLALACAMALAACGGGGGTADDTVDAPPGTADAAPLTCANYCSTIMANCSGANVQYDMMATCLASCATWMVGADADRTGNTLGCRTYHAHAAGADPITHCGHAGPGGNGVCGANCEGFCTLDLGVCTGPDEIYADTNSCMTSCGTWATTPAYSSTVTSGDSLACRLYHATAASTNPGLHCPHTADLSSTCN